MGRGFRIGRLFGIDIRIDASWLFIFFLVTWNLGAMFGQFHPDWGVGLTWGLAILASVLFFASVLSHELAHSLVAKARGIPIRSITLFLFGGVSNIQREPTSPRHEFIMAIVGPVTSIVIGVLLLAFAGTRIGALGLTADPGALITSLDPISTIAFWLGSVNVLVGVFNMIPGFPLDGGRILRSILWMVTHNLQRATRWAAAIGQGISWLFIAAGIAMIFGFQIPFFGSGLLSGLWLAFIGWFLNNAAVQSYQQVIVKDLLEDVPVSRLMRTDPPKAPSDITVNDLVNDYVMATDDYAFPVMDNGRLLGLVTLQDVRNTPREERARKRVGEIMTPAESLVTVPPDEDAAEALNKLSQRDVNQLPVMREGQLVGLMRRRDIVKWLQIQSRTNGG